jgi:hypothetical protein
MAQFMKQFPSHLIRFNLVSLLLLSCIPTVGAQHLKDPTRPPSMTLQGESLVEAGPQLQAILISEKQRVAMINGERIMLNGRIGDQTVVRIEENFVILKRGRSFTTLKLYPEMQKKPANAWTSSVRHPNVNSALNSPLEVKQTSQEGKNK